MAGDLDSLVDMGFDREKSEMALKNGGNLTGAIDWLDKNSSKSVEELKAEAAEDEEEEGAPKLEAGEQARSMVCNECQKKFRSMAQAQFHAEKSGHTDFAESAEELAPLTEEEKKNRLAELKARLAEKRAVQATEEKIAQKRNEEIQRKKTKENDDAKEELQRKEQIKDAQKKKQEKADDLAAKKRIRDKIEADKLARKQKAEEEKKMRENPAAYNPGAPSASTTGGAAAAASQVNKANHSEARLKLQTANGTVMKTLPAETTLFELAEAVKAEIAVQATAFSSNFPRKEFKYEDFGMTLKECGLVPSAMLNVK
ncbi:related to chicken h-caldesmon, Uso1p and YKL201c [Lecanosticta acicola]|uniref:Related to chicken h-caldesmon, Uso1p and YKL201c n=1 Tax=Lecanosticta acicola TaxID=111012 RepID=A0AAI8YTW4_9PEZI|nr:related to chicken h-caldesmon, Uso1p and YKL201c [Lecanosticta acicola]